MVRCMPDRSSERSAISTDQSYLRIAYRKCGFELSVIDQHEVSLMTYLQVVTTARSCSCVRHLSSLHLSTKSIWQRLR